MKKENERLVAQPKGEGKKPLTNPVAPCARMGDASPSCWRQQKGYVAPRARVGDASYKCTVNNRYRCWVVAPRARVGDASITIVQKTNGFEVRSFDREMHRQDMVFNKYIEMMEYIAGHFCCFDQYEMELSEKADEEC